MCKNTDYNYIRWNRDRWPPSEARTFSLLPTSQAGSWGRAESDPKVKLLQPRQNTGEVKESVFHKNLLQEGKAEIHIAKQYKRVLESEGDCWNTPPLLPSHSISYGLKLGSLLWPGGALCLFLPYAKTNCRFPICLCSCWSGSMTSSLPEISCVMDVTTGRGQAQGGTEGTTPHYLLLARPQLRLPLRCTTGFLQRAWASEHSRLKQLFS